MLNRQVVGGYRPNERGIAGWGDTAADDDDEILRLVILMMRMMMP
jgi:hypothetical protein